MYRVKKLQYTDFKMQVLYTANSVLSFPDIALTSRQWLLVESPLHFWKVSI